MTIKSISIEQLIPGMYLVGVNVSWMDTPFLRHKFTVKDQGAIAKLKASGVTRVEIDISKGKDVEHTSAAEPQAATQPPLETPPPPVAAAENAAPQAESPQAEPRPARPAGARVPTAPTGFDEEIHYAKKIRAVAQNVLRKSFDSVRAGESINESMFHSLVEHTSGSSKRNPLTMLTMMAQQPASSELLHHAFNQMGLALLLGQKVGFDGEELDRLGTAALLMDIGWVRLPGNLQRRTHAYTDDDFRMVQQHVKHSVDILEEGGFEDEIIHLVENHHERPDGTGYPEALKKEEISLGSQILSLVNHFESTVHGLYDSAPDIPVKALRSIYARCTEGGHDPDLAKHLISLLGVYPISSAVELDTGEKGVVTRINWKQPLKPQVRVIYGKDRLPLAQPIEVDLAALHAQGKEVKIKGVLEPRMPGADPRGLLVFAEI